MPTQRRYSPEMREQTVRLVAEHQAEYPSQWAAIRSIAEKAGMSTETLRNWVQQAERDSGQRLGLTIDERQKMKDLERDVKELRRANEILKAAASFFARELDPRPRAPRGAMQPDGDERTPPSACRSRPGKLRAD